MRFVKEGIYLRLLRCAITQFGFLYVIVKVPIGEDKILGKDRNEGAHPHTT